MSLCVAFTSLITSLSSDVNVNFYVVDMDIDEQNKQRIRKSIDKFGQRAQLEFLTPNYERFSHLPRIGTFGIEIYLRLDLDLLLPQEIGYVLYIDADIVAVRDVSPLLSLDMENQVMGAVLDEALPQMGYAVPEACLQWKLDMAAPYFNSGVLWINLKRWREEQITQKGD